MRNRRQAAHQSRPSWHWQVTYPLKHRPILCLPDSELQQGLIEGVQSLVVGECAHVLCEGHRQLLHEGVHLAEEGGCNCNRACASELDETLGSLTAAYQSSPNALRQPLAASFCLFFRLTHLPRSSIPLLFCLILDAC